MATGPPVDPVVRMSHGLSRAQFFFFFPHSLKQKTVCIYKNKKGMWKSGNRPESRYPRCDRFPQPVENGVPVCGKIAPGDPSISTFPHPLPPISTGICTSFSTSRSRHPPRRFPLFHIISTAIPHPRPEFIPPAVPESAGSLPVPGGLSDAFPDGLRFSEWHT